MIVEPPKLVRKIFNQFIWENSSREILITIDDGPYSEVTKKILYVLNNNNVKALFFLTGKNIVDHLNLVNEITLTGNFIANHSYSHSKRMIKMSATEIKSELFQTEIQLINNPNFLRIFRPPYGRINHKIKKVLDELNYKVMMWTLLTKDYLGDFSIVKRNLDLHLKENSIIVFHNNPKSENIIQQSLEYTFDLVEKRGYKIGSSFYF